MRPRRLSAAGLLLAAAASVCGCRSAPAPPEVREAEVQDKDLWGAGAPFLDESGYAAYNAALRRARRVWREESLKLGWFRRLDRVRDEFRDVLELGETLKAETLRRRGEKLSAASDMLSALRRKAAALDEATLAIGERGAARAALARSEVLLREAESLTARQEFDPALARLNEAAVRLHEAETAVLRLLERYLDGKLVAQWRHWAEETASESRKRKTAAIVVSKLERRLTLYVAGAVRLECPIGLPYGGLALKLRAGDAATPEGRYRIVRKIPDSQFHKALLLDYPNPDDRRRFDEAKRRGEIPASAAIGGLIEIHGGGRDILTRGCVSVDDADMDVIFAAAAVGTPVTIVGTTESEPGVVRFLRGTG